MRVLFLDPGVTTGWAVVDFDATNADSHSRVKDGLVAFGQIEARDPEGQYTWDIESWAVSEIRYLATIDGFAIDHWVIEDFILQPGRSGYGNGSSGAREGLAPIRIISKIMDRVAEEDVTFQGPSQAKTIATDERMKRWGLWQPGQPHATDALRHAVVYARGKNKL